MGAVQHGTTSQARRGPLPLSSDAPLDEDPVGLSKGWRGPSGCHDIGIELPRRSAQLPPICGQAQKG